MSIEASPTELDSSVRFGLIIPTKNLITEYEFRQYAPRGFNSYVTRIRLNKANGERVPPPELLQDVLHEAEILSDIRPNMIVFHCTASSMEAGVEGEREIVKAMEHATSVQSTTTATGVLAAFAALDIQRVVLISPYVPAVNEHERSFLSKAGIEVLRDQALALPHTEWTTRPGSFWRDMGIANDHPDADAIFLSCTNIRAIEAIKDLEAATGRPVITSNQATLWYCLRLCGFTDDLPELGALGRLQLAVPEKIPAA